MTENKLSIEKLKNLQWKIMQDVSASALIPLMRIGDELGLFIVLGKKGPCTESEFSNFAKIDQRYAKEWLLAMCAAGYVSHSDEVTKFYMSEEQKAVFSFEESSAFMLGAFDILSGNIHNIEKVKKAFKTGQGVNYDDSHPCIFSGTARFFRPSYSLNLLKKWIPAIPDVERKLKNGCNFADIGCGFGISSMMIADAFQNSKIFGFDMHKPSIEIAIKDAKKQNLNNAKFEVADAESYCGKYDVITFFDCLHDMGDPLAASKYAFNHLNEDGTLILIEPSASDSPKENFNTIGQMYYSFSTMGCIPTSKSQKKGLALGAQAGPKKLIKILQESGFNKCEIVKKNATNMIITAKK